jgi:hypothetical protein
MNQEREQAADELDLLLTALVAGQEAPVPQHLPAEEAALAAELLHLAADIDLDPVFAADLETRLLTRAETLTMTNGPIGNRVARRRWIVPVPHLASGRRVTWTAAAMLVLVVTLLTVPPVRAGMFAFLQIGTVRIFPAEPPTTEPSLTITRAPAAVESLQPSPTPLASVLDLAGETTLDAARREVGFPIRLPSYPADLGPPERVFIQDLGGPAVVLVWLDPNQPGRIQFSLHQLGSGIDLNKIRPVIIQETTVHGQPALWTTGPYTLEIQPSTPENHYYADRRLVQGHVLLWAEGEVTYRLETDLTLEAAVRIAESLR